MTKAASSSPVGTPRRLHVILASALALSNAVFGADWPQVLGPDRNGVYPGNDLADSWPEAGPEVVWRKKVGHGFSNPVVAAGRLILFHRVGDKEVVQAFDAKNVAEQWSFEYPTTYRDDFGFDPGPRASPVVDEGRVYTFGAQGVLHCLDFATGKKIWSVATHEKFGVRKGFFGAACSPLVEGGRVFLNVGGPRGAGVAAFDKDTGEVAWTATNDEASYSSPVAATLNGKRHILFLTRNGLVATGPEKGEVRFQFRWRPASRASVSAAFPLVMNGRIFLSASYGTGAVLLRVNGNEVEKLWSSDDALSNHYATSVYHDGHLYGFHGRQEYGQSLRAVELGSGRVRWSEDGFGAGTLTVAGDRLLILRENGELVLAEASPERFQVISRAKILPGVVRAYPAIADGLLYARNEDTLICVRLKK